MVIAVRNEAGNIGKLLQDLERQTYPPELTEVIVVNDHSTDETEAIVTQCIPQAKYTLRLLNLQDYLNEPLVEGNYKKKAIELSVNQATGQLIVTTDGDCRVQPDWLRLFAQTYAATGAKMLCGGVTFAGERTLFERFQTVEFASLIGSGAATLQLGVPTMCNAANLAFEKQAFQQVGGYADESGAASGDDVFLLHKLHKAFPNQMYFLKNPASTVFTRAKATWRAFYWQRKRWASKWKLYRDWRVTALAVFIFLSNLSLLLAWLLVLSGNYPVRMFWLQIALRFSAEFVLLTSVLRYFGKQKLIGLILPLQLIYFFYAVFFGIAAQKKGYQWKGRTLR